MAIAELEGTKSDTLKKQAEAFRAMVLAEKEKAAITNLNVDSMDKAMIAAQAVITMPTISRVADGMLQEAGFTPPKVSIPLSLPPMQGSQPFPQAPQPPQQPPMAMPQQQISRPQAVAMPPQEGLSQNMPMAAAAKQAETQALTASVAAMKDISQGTIGALSEITDAIASMAESMKEASKPKQSRVVIEKQADGSFVGKKVDD
jgi:hypothetical protein